MLQTDRLQGLESGGEDVCTHARLDSVRCVNASAAQPFLNRSGPELDYGLLRAVYDGSIYYTLPREDAEPDRSRLLRIPIVANGEGYENLVLREADSISSLAIDANGLVGAEVSNSVGSLHRLGGQTVEDLGAPLAGEARITMDESFVYATLPHQGQVVRVQRQSPFTRTTLSTSERFPVTPKRSGDFFVLAGCADRPR